MNNVITAVFGYGKIAKTREVWKIDHGMKLNLVGITLPDVYQVHFANSPDIGEASVVVASSDTVDIPDIYFASGKDVYAWIYLTPETGVGYTVYMVKIPVKVRPKVSEYEPTPVQQNAIDQAIGALNEAVAQTGQDVIDTNAAKIAAETAQGLAEAAQSAAERAQGTAEQAESNASTSARNAAGSASDASDSATAAQTAQGLAENARDAAAVSANRAEQAANKAGYMDFEINDNGHLIYTRTDAVDVNFILDDGHLYMEVI